MVLYCHTARIGRSPTKVAEAAGLSRRNVYGFFRSNALKSLLVKVRRIRFLSAKKSKSSLSLVRGQSRFLSVPLEIASAYWLWQAHRGKKTALALCLGLRCHLNPTGKYYPCPVTKKPLGDGLMRDDVGLGTVERQTDAGFAWFAGFCENLEDTEKQQL
jgi:hypothetical protein